MQTCFAQNLFVTVIFSVIIVWFVVCFVKQFENFLPNRIEHKITELETIYQQEAKSSLALHHCGRE